MSAPTHSQDASQADPLEKIIHTVPVVIPAVGALLIFLLAFIAVFMA